VRPFRSWIFSLAKPGTVECPRMQFALSRAEVAQYAHRNQYAMMMFMDAASDYFACRCCILNNLFSGFRLASEAVEKLLKAFIFLQTGNKSTLKRRDRHNPYLLKEELKRSRPDQTLDAYDDVLHRLYNHFLSRYFDNAVSDRSASGGELPQIDELFFHLVESLPMPEEVKYRSAFFSHLCDQTARHHWKTYHWAMQDNHVLRSRIESIERKYQQVFTHLYG
jgi:hypothetical protein